MANNRVATRAGAVQRVMTTTLLLTGLLLASCAPGIKSGPRLRLFAADLTGGAKVCDATKIDPVAGASSEAAIKVANDGGWCGIYVHQAGPKPFGAGLLVKRPNHGSVTIHEVGDNTRIDYTPDHGFAGSDDFEAKLVPGNAALQVKVTVIPPVQS